VRGAGLLALGYIGTQAVTIGVYAVLARLAPPSTFGAFAAASIIVAAGTFLSESGMTAALVRRPGAIDAAAATATVSTFAAGVFLSLLALALSPLVGLFFRSGQIGDVAAALSGLLFLNAVAVVPGALLQRRLSLRPRLFIEPFSALVVGVASGVALAAGLGIWGLAVGAYASAVFRAGSLWLFGGWLPRLGDASWAMWKELTAFARHIVASEGLRYTGTVASTAVVGRTLGTTSLGVYGAGWRIAEAGAKLTSVGQYMLLPAFSRIAAEPLRFRQAFERALRTSALVVFPVFAVFLSLGEPIAVLLFGDVWAEAGQVLMALSFLAVTGAVGSVAAEAVKAAGRPDILPPATALAAIVPIALMFLLLPLGAVGVGLAFSIGYGISMSYVLVRGSRVVGVPFGTTLGLLRAPAVGAIGFAVVAFSLDRFLLHAADHSGLLGFVLLGIAMLAGGLAYVVIAMLLSSEVAVELRTILRMLIPRIGASQDRGSLP
jgi:PST family polysaccharide transporter